ncbi:MAG: hypothetical protein AB1349_06275 [Elusimicrobiota bacterium]
MKEQSEIAKQELRERNRQYLVWEHLTRNQKEAAKRILAGNYGILQDAGWGFLDKFIIFLKTVGFLEVLNVDGEGYVRRMITVAQLLLTYQMKILMAKQPFQLINPQHYLLLLQSLNRSIVQFLTL